MVFRAPCWMDWWWVIDLLGMAQRGRRDFACVLCSDEWMKCFYVTWHVNMCMPRIERERERGMNQWASSMVCETVNILTTSLGFIPPRRPQLLLLGTCSVGTQTTQYVSVGVQVDEIDLNTSFNQLDHYHDYSLPATKRARTNDVIFEDTSQTQSTPQPS